MKGLSTMKRTSIICLILVLTIAASLLSACLDREAKNDLELLMNSISNSSAAFSEPAETEEPDLSNGMKMSLKADLGNMLGIKIDADLIAKTGDSTVIGVNLNELLMEGTSLEGISAALSADELALKVKAVKDSYVGIKFDDLKKVLADKFLTELPEETIAQIEDLRKTLRENISVSAESAPELTSKQIEFLYNKLLEKKIISAEKKDNVTVISFNGNGSAFIDTFNVFVEELKKDEKWNKFITEFNTKLKDALEASGEESFDSIDDVYDYIYESLEIEEIEEDIKSMSIDVKVTVEKIKSLDNATFVTAAEMAFTADGETLNAKIEAGYEGDPFCKMTLTSSDPSENIVISLEKKTNSETSSTLSFSVKDNGETVTALSYTFDKATGEYEIIANVEIEGAMQEITLEGTYKISKDAVELTVDLFGMDTLLIKPNVSVKITPVGADESVMPSYTGLDQISDEDLMKFFEFFGLVGEDER